MHKVKTGVQNMYMKYTCASSRIAVKEHLFICCMLCSYLATTVRSAPVVSLHNGFRGTFS